MRIKYGGAVTGLAEERAVIKSIRKSRRTRNWQTDIEARKMEEESARFLGVKYGVLTTSGSCAGLLALSALELPKGSEVIISAVTFPTIFNMILQCGLKPVVVDVDASYNFDLNEVKKAISKKTSAIIAIHALGNPLDLVKLRKIAGKLPILLDNCDGFGTTLHGKSVESYVDIAFTSFHAAHIVSMGVGGCVYTNDKELAKKVRMYRDWGRQADLTHTKNTKWKSLPEDYNPRFIYEKIGYNFQPLELQAAMGRVQLRKINKIKKIRQRNVDYLIKHIGFKPKVIRGADVCWFAFPITYEGDRGDLISYLEKRGIETRSMFSGDITRHPAYEGLKIKKGKLSVADYVLKHSFWISCHPSLTKKQLKYIVKVFNDYFA